MNIFRRLLASWKSNRRAADAYATLRGLDPRTLRDIGIDPSELRSVACELAGLADRQRRASLFPTSN